MSGINERLVRLSPEKRALLERWLTNRETSVSGGHAISRRESTKPCPLSFAQQRLWFLSQMEPESVAYNIPNALRMTGALNLEALRKTLDNLVALHQVLRTTFGLIEGSPMRVVTDTQGVELQMVDLSVLPDLDRETELQRLLVESRF